MESIIPKINFLKNENCIFTFFKFWNIDLNFIFLFFWNANSNSNLSFNWNWNKIWIYGVRLWRQRTFVWLVDVCFVLCLILFNYFLLWTMTLRQTKWIVGKRIVEIFQRRQHDHRLNDGCFHENLAIHLSSSFENYF